MARYINAEIIDYDDYWYNKGFSARDCLQAQQLIEEQPTADVVEREKIDKAIEGVDRYLFEQEFGSDYRKDVKEVLNKTIGKENS